MALHIRRGTLGLETGLNTRLIYPLSQLVSHLTGIPIPQNKAITGAGAFAYTSGMYQNGALRGKSEDEIMDPADIGILQAQNVAPVLTGREGLRHTLTEMGYSLDAGEFSQVYNRFRELVRKKPSVELADLEAIVSGETAVFVEETYELLQLQISSGTNTLPVAAVRLQGPEGEPVWSTSHGNGPVDASFKAISSTVGLPSRLLEYSVQAMTEGGDALAKVTVRIEGEVVLGDTGRSDKRVFLGRGADTDLIVASAKAYLFALNRYFAARQASQRRQAVTREVRQVLEEMSARYGTAHTGDMMGWSAMRGEDLV